ncbi:MAG: hypothetical protein IJW05_12635 [Lentisphaeria bacterium]|nr:hypothetical protein [Lentisphaeria bacterium]
MNTSYEKKAIYRDRENIFQFVKTFGVGQGKTFFFTLTFSDNVTDRKIAGEHWNLLNTAIKKMWNDFKYILVAERQKRGAWHFHVLGNISSLPSLNVFLKYVRGFFSVSSKPFGFCKCIWTYGKSYKGVAAYMTKYMQKQEREKGVRLVCYSRNWIRAVILPFSWVNGAAKRWRESCNSLNSTFPGLFKYMYWNSSFSWKLDIINAQQNSDFNRCYDLVFKFASKLFPGSLYQSVHVDEVLLYSKKKHFLSDSDFKHFEDEQRKVKLDFFNFGKYFSMIPGAAQ